MSAGNVEIEEMIQANGSNAPRVSYKNVEDKILTEQYYVFPGTTTTVCCLILKNGFTTIGHSACASAANFNEAIGRCIAKENAVDQVWQLEGYLLKQRLYEEEQNANV